MDEDDARYFPDERPCHDCAFRPGSPEREDPVQWEAILTQVDAGAPFHCHYKHDGTEMPRDEDGKYRPSLHRDGRPVGFPLCAGWAAHVKAKHGVR